MFRYVVSALAAVAAASPVSNIQPRQVAGQVYSSCTVGNTVALTFDDGPFTYTDGILDALAAAGMKATFFVNGQNWANINDYSSTVQRMINEGHQIGSHTMFHGNLAQMDAAGVTAEMTQLEDVLLNMIGQFPTYMRPPYFAWNDQTLQTLGGLGYKVIHADIDTLDWQNNTPDTTGNSANIFAQGLDSGGSISLAHDVHPTTANNLVPAMIDAIQARGLNAVTVGECLGDSADNWYRTSRDGTTPPPGNGGGDGGNGGTTPDGTCGGSNGYSCPSGSYKCCSQYGWCGDSAEHCGAGCNPAFGVCS